MKATKIMGAVLGVLLVAALFIGAGAAATATVDTVFPYQNLTTKVSDGTYYLLDGKDLTSTSVQVVNGYIGTTDIIPGVYALTDEKPKFILAYPSISLVATATVKYPYGKDGEKTTVYDLAGASVVNDLDDAVVTLDIKATSVAGINNISLLITNPTGSKTTTTKFVNGVITLPVNKNKFAKGTWTIQPYYDNKDNAFVANVPSALKYGEEYTFNVISAEDESLTLSADTVTVGDYFLVTVHGVPGVTYKFSNSEEIEVVKDQEGVDLVYDKDGKFIGATFKMGASGVKGISFVAVKKIDEKTITLEDATATNEVEATVTILAGTLTVEADKSTYIIGQDIKLSGTSSAEDTPLYFYIEGQNIPFTQLKKDANSVVTVSGAEWDQKITPAILNVSVGHLDVGTYSVYVSTYNVEAKVSDAEKKKGKDAKDLIIKKEDNSIYAPISFALQQSFIRLTTVPDVVAQGEEITVEGIADAGKSVIWYLFGTNFFETGVAKVKSDDSFKITIDEKYTDEKYMAAGQYFLVVQHPMYDKLYAVAPNNMNGWAAEATSFEKTGTAKPALINEATKDGIYTWDDKLVATNGPSTSLFNTDVRQTSNAAQALCDALDSQNFDDMYVKASFIVGSPESMIDPIPSQITKGQILTVSGTSTGHKGDSVFVELRSTAFAATPKGTVGSASFIALTTTVGDDGKWVVSFDTSNLNADEYTCSVAVAQLTATTKKVTIVEGTGPQPTQTTGPVTPTTQPTAQPTAQPTPATPGFGALAALAGLGAVAVLLLRRE